MVTTPDNELREEISVYARISVDTEKESDSNTSIENQLRIINTFIQQHFPNCTVKEYIDRDRSGYTFEQRENYMKMRERIFDGTSKILIVKDFSRFSRRTSLGLWELEQMRDKGARIISILDSIDYPKDDNWQVISMHFVMNEAPVTKTSENVKKSIKIMQQRGEWLCAVPYGYVLEEVKKQQVVSIVPDEAEVVKEVFRLYSHEGWGYKKIANYLTDKHIPTPRMKEKQRAEENDIDYKRKVSNAWSVQTLDGMLRNDFYIGVYRGHKYTRKSIKGADKRLEDSEHIVIEKHHKSIIDDKTFLYTQEVLSKRTTTHYRGVKKYDTPYTSYLFCGDCGSPMFSRSRPDLAPAYICGTYHKQNSKNCTTHHTRVDFLDSVLKDYIRLVKLNCRDMIEELEKTIASEETSVKDSDKLIKLLENHLANAKEELKALKKQKIKDLARKPDEADITEETYAELEQEAINKIHGYQAQYNDCINKRSSIVEIARVARTVFDVFDDVLKKEKLSKVDISLIVDKIVVFEDGTIDVHLKSDIEQLLKTGTLPNKEETVNFNFDSIGILFNAEYSQKVRNQKGKAYTVNVVSEGDPLEIYTDKEGGVIFKKYSLMGGVADFAGQLCDTLSRTTGRIVVITDRDNCIAVAGAPRRELAERPISAELEQLMEGRKIYQHKDGEAVLPLFAEGDKYSLGTAAPILAEGDVLGCVIFVDQGESPQSGEVEYKLAQSIAGFLGRHMES